MVGTLRQAFYDQSDGRARVEAVTSLLLSEHYHRLQEQSVAGGAGETAKAVTENYLTGREELQLDAHVSAPPSAAYHLHKKQRGRPARASSAPGERRTSSSSTSSADRLSKAFVSTKEADEGVGVESVLREMDQVNRRRLRRFQRKHRRHRHKRRRSRRHVGTTLSLVDDEDAQRHDERHLSTEGEHDELDSKAEGSASNQRPPGGSAGYFSSKTEADLAGDLTSRLALAASASILDGLLVRGARNTGTVHDGSSYELQSSIGDAAVVDPAAARVGEDACSERIVVSEGNGDSDVGGLLRAVRRLNVPLVMVQSTEDALVGTPLPLVLQKEVCYDWLDCLLNSWYSCSSCSHTVRSSSGSNNNYHITSMRSKSRSPGSYFSRVCGHGRRSFDCNRCRAVHVFFRTRRGIKQGELRGLPV